MIDQDADRSQAIYCSELAAFLGKSPYKSPARAIGEKAGLLAPEDLGDNDAVKAGNFFESGLLEWYREIAHIDRFECPGAKEFVWAENDRLRGHADILVYDGSTITGGCDAKYSNDYNAWRDVDGVDRVPEYVNIQCQGYMAIFGLRQWDVFAFVGRPPPKIYTIMRNEKLIRNLGPMIEALWQIVEGVKSEGLKSLSQFMVGGKLARKEIDLLNEIYGVEIGKSIELSSQASMSSRKLVMLEAEKKIMNSKISEINGKIDQERQVIIKEMGSAEKAYCDGMEYFRKKISVKARDSYTYTKFSKREVRNEF